MKRSMCILLSAVLLGAPLIGHAETSQEKGLAIASEMKSRNIGWGDSQSDLVMTLRTKKGQEVVRQMRSKSLEVQGDGDKGLTIFDTPLDVKGTAFLSFSHISGGDDQWLYLPALKRVKRIASRNKSGPFLGSEFAFEDLSSFEVEKYTYNFLRDDSVNGIDVFVVENRPIDKYSGYTRTEAWIDKEHYRVQKIVYFDRRDTLLKTLTVEGYKLYKDKYWRSDGRKMVNHKTGKSTDLKVNNLTFDVGLSGDDFNENRLQRAR
ncbi:MAG: outer membrane lipoprotein-sorting protein [Cryomorphaceae bacterium]|jgi:outer membrane lipoprotein-sorting protein